MPKNRSTLYTVVRENLDQVQGCYKYSALVGTYITFRRAEEIAAVSHQAFIDSGADPSWFQFSVHPVTFYDE